MTVRVLYFAYFRERAGRAGETVSLPASVATVGQLMDWLKEQGDGREKAFAEPSLVRVAVNQNYVTLDHPVRSGDEIAFFPPVTGG